MKGVTTSNDKTAIGICDSVSTSMNPTTILQMSRVCIWVVKLANKIYESNIWSF